MKLHMRLRIGGRITAGFATVLALLVVTSGVGYLSLHSADSSFNTYRGLARATNAIGRVQANMLMTRMNVKDFIIRGTAEEADEVRHFEELTSELIEEALHVVVEEEHIALLEEIKTDLAEYALQFENVVERQQRRDEIVNGQLNQIGPQIERKLTEIMESAFQADDAEAAVYAGRVLRNLLLGRLYVMRFLVDNDDASYERVMREFAALEENAHTLLESLQNPQRRALASEVEALVLQYEAAFGEVYDVIVARNGIIVDRLDVIGPEIAVEIEAFKLAIKSEQDTLGPRATADMENAVTVMLMVAAIAMAIGALAAFVISRGISRPVVGMTAAMRTIAEGNTAVEVPARGQADEIGEMAAAVQVFKENMVRNAELAAAAAQEQEARDRRSERVSQLTSAFDADVGGTVDTLASAATQLQSTADSLSSAADDATSQAAAVASASEESSTNVQTVATATEELNSSIAEISRQVTQQTDLAGKAVGAADASNRQVQELADRARRIGEVVDLITSIAEQTNLLALNATIEAARAGDAGKGFAVVASEVKSLANQTAKATEEIASQINAVQTSTEAAVDAIEGIGSRIKEIDEITATVASAVEEQTAATQEIARNIQRAAQGTHEVSSNIVGVSSAAQRTGGSAGDVRSASGELGTQADRLKGIVQQFLGDVRSA